MRILHAVEFYAPSRGGAQEVVRQISERIVLMGHDVTVATSRLPERRLGTLNGVRFEEFAVSGNLTLGYRGDVESYRRFLVESDFDVVLAYACQQWTTDAFLEVADDVRAVKICAPCGYSALHDDTYASYFARLPRLLAKMDATIYHSAWYQDIEFARSHGLTNLHVIPNGAAGEEFETVDPLEVERFRAALGIRGTLVLAVGSHTGAKGHIEAVTAFSLAPIGPATLLIVGNGKPGEGCFDECASREGPLAPPRGPRKRVLVRDLPRDELVLAFHAADVLVHLSRVECSPIVLYEAAASGTPFVSSDAGNAREIATWTGAGVVVGSRQPDGRVRAAPWRAALALTELLRDRKRRSEMSEQGRQTWHDRFTWGHAARSYLGLYEQLRGPAGPGELPTTSQLLALDAR